jgi:hypothetical protein
MQMGYQKYRQCNDKKEKYEKTTMAKKTLHIKLILSHTNLIYNQVWTPRSPLKPGENRVGPNGFKTLHRKLKINYNIFYKYLQLGLETSIIACASPFVYILNLRHF